ncbi:MAG: DUF167 family protein [Arenicellales bacterium]|nr:DUF167 family protein [Arenicellales bacterium]
MDKSAYRWKDNSLILKVPIQPLAKHQEIEGFQADTVRIRIKAAPVDGKANTQLFGLSPKHSMSQNQTLKLLVVPILTAKPW